MFAIDHYQEFSANISASDRDLYSYGILNILDEVFTAAGPVHSLPYHEEYFVVIYNGPPDCCTPQKWVELVMQAQINIQKYFKISLSSIIGSTGILLSSIHHEVQQCIEAADYRIFRGTSMVAFLSEIQTVQNNVYLPPDSELKNLTNQLLLGKKEEIFHSFHQLLNNSHEYSCDALKTLLLKLLFLIQEALESKGGNMNFTYISEGLKYISNISGDTSLTQIEVWFSRFIEEAFLELEKAQTRMKTNQNTSVHIDKIMEDVSRSDGDPNLTPEYLADKFHISSNYFKRVFRTPDKHLLK